jgi:hypothetical protein
MNQMQRFTAAKLVFNIVSFGRAKGSHFGFCEQVESANQRTATDFSGIPESGESS